MRKDETSMGHWYRNRTVIFLVAAATIEPLDYKVEEVTEGWTKIRSEVREQLARYHKSVPRQNTFFLIFPPLLIFVFCIPTVRINYKTYTRKEFVVNTSVRVIYISFD